MNEIDKDYPKVSVITVCLNSKKYLEETIKSVSMQTYSNIEYIIIDGGSTDGSAELFNKYRHRINNLLIEKDSGIFDAMNKGVRLSTGEAVYFLNSGDKFYDEKTVEKAVNVLKENREIDFVYGNIVIFDPVNKMFYVEKYPKRISKWLFIKKTIAHPASFFRSSCFEKIGYFNQAYRIGADYEWYLRAIFDRGLKGVYMDTNISIFRLGGNSSAERDIKSYFSERILIQNKYFSPIEILYTRFVFIVRLLLREKCTKFLHDIKTACFSEKIKC